MAFDVDRVWVTGEVFPHSTKQVNKAGDRIRRATARDQIPVDDDLRLLDLYRSSHYPALREVRQRVARCFYEEIGLTPLEITITARPLKTRGAIRAKLVRERSRLSTIQDIAGARIVVQSPHDQDLTLETLFGRFEGWNPRISKDTRAGPDELGYRAVHVVVTTSHEGIGARPAEIQIRTVTQEAWAQIVESLDGRFGTDLKHGNGPAEWLKWLLEMSDYLASGGPSKRDTMPELPKEPQEPRPQA
jgi:ppGpp synthetase/RelA/SpoT-type nucleotidyltranferase